MNGAASAKCGFRTELPDESHLVRGNGFWSCSRVYPAYQIQPVPFMAGASVIHKYSAFALPLHRRVNSFALVLLTTVPAGTIKYDRP
jgi:hypothetical protein